jgi:hypothetical protein
LLQSFISAQNHALDSNITAGGVCDGTFFWNCIRGTEFYRDEKKNAASLLCAGLASGAQFLDFLPARFPDSRVSGHNGEVHSMATYRRVLRSGCVLALWCAGLLPAMQAQTAPALTLDTTQASLHGFVRNGATGEGVPRALVRIEGDANTGALTDGEGRFEISGITVGPQSVQVLKPGFRDGASSAASEGSASHNVLVAVGMADVIFTLTPSCAIHGQIDLSTGEQAEGIEVSLIRKMVEDGRAFWQAGARTKTRNDGTFRFAGLAAGEYALYTEPAMGSEAATALVDPGAVERRGYASVFFPDARDLAGAAKIHLSPGQDVQASMTLTLEPFHTVTAEVAIPDGARNGAGNSRMVMSAEVMDAQGHILPYTVRYDDKTETVQTSLPDGNYSLLAELFTGRILSTVRATSSHAGSAAFSPSKWLFTGSAEFSVAGHPVSNLRISLGMVHGSPVQATVTRTGDKLASASVVVLVSSADGGIDGGVVSAFANGQAPGSLETTYATPGSYWVHTHIGQKGLCEASFTSGGANLAREPVTIGHAGPTVPMELVLRDDCAQLQLSLPASLSAMAAGVEPFYTVYAVPDFDSTVDVQPVTLRPSTGGAATLESLTPGSYHVYTFAGPMLLAYRNLAVLAALPGQAVTLSPGATSGLVLEAPEH